jgi:hypothetical protein
VNNHGLKNRLIGEMFAGCLEKHQSLPPRVKHDIGHFNTRMKNVARKTRLNYPTTTACASVESGIIRKLQIDSDATT